MSHESVEWMDAHNPIDNGEYDARLKRLTEGITEVNGLPLNFKVYYVVDINAFACGDGSIRVFSSLMDIMDDDELMSIIGHEIGHVVNHDVKDAMKNAYLASAARNAAGAAGGVIGKLSESELGAVACERGVTLPTHDAISLISIMNNSFLMTCLEQKRLFANI